jgi:hypothetical protein
MLSHQLERSALGCTPSDQCRAVVMRHSGLTARVVNQVKKSSP